MDLDKLEKLCQEATREPWAIDTTHRVIDIINESQPDIRIALIPREGMNDALFIVEARTALPELIERVRYLEAMYEDIDMTPEQVAQLVDYKATESENIFLRKESIQVSLENIELKKRVREAEKIITAAEEYRENENMASEATLHRLGQKLDLLIEDYKEVRQDG